MYHLSNVFSLMYYLNAYYMLIFLLFWLYALKSGTSEEKKEASFFFLECLDEFLVK